MIMQRKAILSLLVGVVILLAAGAAVYVFVQRARADDYGAALALCPGPDLYGYTCESGTAFAYIDAANDTQLYALDGTTTIPIPFPFTFYGTTYTEVTAVTNGNLQFTTPNPAYVNQCLTDGRPAKGMGDLIAPYWHDLDLRQAGFLETELAGEEPNRILVIEWDDVPFFDNPDDKVTFEVQLFEGSNDIVFLYEDVTTFDGNNGSSATIGLQSEDHGIALQFGCNQPVVADATQLRFPHPDRANAAVDSLDTAVTRAIPQAGASLRGDTAVLPQQLALYGRAALPELRQRWLNQSPPVMSAWEEADLLGNGRNQLILTRYSAPQNPGYTELVVLQIEPDGAVNVLFQQYLSDRSRPIPRLKIVETADLTRDNLPDVLLHDDLNGNLFALTAVSGELQLLPIPGQCDGNLGVVDVDGDGRMEIARDGCGADGRVVTGWDGEQFTVMRDS